MYTVTAITAILCVVVLVLLVVRSCILDEMTPDELRRYYRSKNLGTNKHIARAITDMELTIAMLQMQQKEQSGRITSLEVELVNARTGT